MRELSLEVVTADGRVLRTSVDENAELFWGLKGGGGSFSVVKEFQFRLHPIGPLGYGGMVLHPRAAATQLLRCYRDFMEAAPEQVWVDSRCSSRPAGPTTPPGLGTVRRHS